MLSVCLCTTLTIVDVISGIVIMWTGYIFFSLGLGNKPFCKVCQSNENTQSKYINNSNLGIVRITIIASLSLCIYILTAYFYTGLTPASLVKLMKNGQSAYQHYQSYFASNGLSQMTLSKLPVVLAMGANRIIWVYSFIILTVSGKIKYKRYKIYLITLSIGHLYFGLCRGTNFEMYQLCLLIYICYILWSEKNNKKINYSLLFCIGCFMVIFFLTLLKLRGHTIELVEFSVANIDLERNSVFVRFVPMVVMVIEWIFGYLGYGIYYISVMIQEVMTGKEISFLDFFIPIENASKVTNILADKAVKCEPSYAIVLDHYGIVGVLLFPFCLGMFLRVIGGRKYNTYLYYVMYYVVVVEMISYPIASYLSFSSEKILIAITVFAVFIKRYFPFSFKGIFAID